MSARPWRAASISVSVGPVVSVANVEHLVHDLSNGREWVELSALHLVEQPPQLGIPGDRALEMGLRAGGGDREHPASGIPAPPLLQQPFAFEEGAVGPVLPPRLRPVLPAGAPGPADRGPPARP